MQNKFSVIFMGTPEIAAQCLTALIEHPNIEVIAAVCQPDRPVGRKQENIYCAVKKVAIDNNIKILQPQKIAELLEDFKQLEPDLIFTCAFGQFIPESILQIPQYKCVNLHASLLPELRGGAPIHWAIIQQKKVTGFTLMYMAKQMDAGNIIKQIPIDIIDRETYASLYKKLCEEAYKIVKENVISLFSEKITSIAQNEKKVTFGYNISKQDEKIDWNNDCLVIDAKIRGLFDKPIAYTTLNDQIIKIHQAHYDKSFISNQSPGTIIEVSKNHIKVCAKNGAVNLQLIQLESKKPLLVNQIINGNHPFKIGLKFN